MKLYDFPFSPNCRKVRAVAYELDITLEFAPVNLLQGDHRAPAFLARNPMAVCRWRDQRMEACCQ